MRTYTDAELQDTMDRGGIPAILFVNEDGFSQEAAIAACMISHYEDAMGGTHVPWARDAIRAAQFDEAITDYRKAHPEIFEFGRDSGTEFALFAGGEADVLMVLHTLTGQLWGDGNVLKSLLTVENFAAEMDAIRPTPTEAIYSTVKDSPILGREELLLSEANNTLSLTVRQFNRLGRRDVNIFIYLDREKAIAFFRSALAKLDPVENPVDVEELRSLMRDRRYWQARDPVVVERVQTGFRKLASGK